MELHKLGTSVAEQAQPIPSSPPQTTYHFVELPKTNLHYMKCGDGPPLIMVPATISKIENWQALAQFMGQRFTVYFFELPGHGKSSPYDQPFSSELVAQTINDFVDRMGHTTFSLMGFSFGGILASKALQRLQERIDKVILVSPAVSARALAFSPARIWLLRRLVRLLRIGRLRNGLLRAIHSRKLSNFSALWLRRVMRIENTIPMHEVFQKITTSTAEVLSYQMQEMLHFELAVSQRFRQRCFFAMSIYDPLLRFEQTLKVLEQAFEHVHVERMYLPYHQPPRPPTFEEICRQYAGLLDYVSTS